MTKQPLIAALGASAYIVAVVFIMNRVTEPLRDKPDTFFCSCCDVICPDSFGCSNGISFFLPTTAVFH